MLTLVLFFGRIFLFESDFLNAGRGIMEEFYVVLGLLETTLLERTGWKKS